MATNFTSISDRLWEAADKLRANTPLRAPEYSVPVLGLIFLKFADQKFAAVDAILQERVRTSGGSFTLEPYRYRAEGAMYLDASARYANLRKLDTGIDEALNNAMRRIEADNESLRGALPTNAYSILDNNTLKALLATFDGIPLDIEGDLFGKIYEYFLSKFALSEGKLGGEFFTPTSIVKLIVEIIEPYHGLIFDPACGSGGMFVQSAQFVQRHRRDPNEEFSVYGQEKTLGTVRLCKMNLAVHGLSGDVKDGNSYYEDPFSEHDTHRWSGLEKFDFVMANPPFNVDGVEKSRLLAPRQRYPFGIPRVDNANYLWIQLFYSSLKQAGRAGFVMPNSASDAGHSERDIRRQLIQQRVVDVMVSTSPNLFYTVPLSCTLWFLDKGKRESERGNNVLFIDARHIFKQIDRTHRELTPTHIEFLANIVRLYRGEAIENENESASLMQEHFPDGIYIDNPGLCKVVTLADIEAQGWSLNPGRYVGVAERAEADFDFKEKLEELHEELTRLNNEAHKLEGNIDEHMIRLLDEMGD